MERVLRSAKVVAMRDYSSTIGAEFRHPFLQVPLVAFMCAIPSDLQFSPSQDRVLQRQAFARSLPPDIINRRSKGDPSQATYSGLERGEWWRAIHHGTHLAARGYVDHALWKAAVDLARLGRCESIMHFKAAATLEIWLAGLERVGRESDAALQSDGLSATHAVSAS
jgi:hypothetical protein